MGIAETFDNMKKAPHRGRKGHIRKGIGSAHLANRAPAILFIL